MEGRYAHAKQFNRHHRQVRFLRTRLGRLIRDIRCKIAGHEPVEAAFEGPLSRASQDPLAAPASAWLEALFLPRPGGRMHRQGQGPRALGVRRKGVDRDHQCPSARRPVRAARRSAAGQSLRRPHIADRPRGQPCASPVARSNGFTSTRDIVGTTRRIRGASSSLVRSAVSSAPSNESCAADPPSNPSSAT